MYYKRPHFLDIDEIRRLVNLDYEFTLKKYVYSGGEPTFTRKDFFASIVETSTRNRLNKLR